MSTKDQVLSDELHGEALLTAKRPELQPLIDHLREVALGRDDIRVECAGIIAGSWFSSAARRGEDLIAAGLLMLAGHVDLDELDRWMRIVGSVAAGQMFRTGRDSQERNPRSRSRIRFRFDLDRTPPMALRDSFACIGRYAPQQPPPTTTLLWRRRSYVRIIAESATALPRHKAGGL
jgi:hypothetical protein